MSKEISYDEILDYYKKTKEIYEEFKKFREKLGKPLRPFLTSAKETREVLSSKSFSEILELIQSRRQST